MSLQGYAPIFAECEKNVGENYDYSSFRDDPNFSFACARGPQRSAPEYPALGMAASFNPSLCSQFMLQQKLKVGYKDPNDFLQWDVVDSRHIMMLTFLFDKLGTGRENHRTIVEIGGGFGNWLRLAQGIVSFDRWVIIDLPFMVRLQQWYLNQALASSGGIEVEFVGDTYHEWKKNFQGCELVIGAHSLSEFGISVFDDYFNHVVTKCDHLFYATHVALPSRELVMLKLNRIRQLFPKESGFVSEGGMVFNALFSR